MRLPLRVGAIIVLVLSFALPAFADVSQEDVDGAASRLQQLRERADALVARYEDAWAQSEQLADQIESLTGLVADSQVNIGIAEREVQDRAVEMYMSGTGSELFTAFLLGGGVNAGIGYLEETAQSDQMVINNLVTLREAYQRQVEDLESAQQEQDTVTGSMKALATQVLTEISAAQTTYETLKAQRAEQLAEEERRRVAEEQARSSTTTTSTVVPSTTTTRAATTTAPTSTTAPATTTSETTTTTTAPTTTTTTESTTTTETTTTTTAPVTPLPAGSQVCPIDGFTAFSDTFGAPRSGGRTHEGVDMMAERWTHVVAIESGTIYQLKEGGLGGITVWLHSDSEDSYYYAHLQDWAEGLYKGQRVEAGQLIGYVGTSGNAPDYLPHLHFEYHPGHGDAVDPYPLVKSLCG